MSGVDIFERAELHLLDLENTNLIFNNAIEFSEFVETLALKNNVTATQILLEYCETYDIEYDELAKMITPSLKGKIASEMQDFGLLPKDNRLEFED